jgi:hypothetical protein
VVIVDGVPVMDYQNEDAWPAGLSGVFALAPRRDRHRGTARYGAMRMVDEYVAVYERLVRAHADGRGLIGAGRSR